MKKLFSIFAGLLISVSVFSQASWSLTGNAGTTNSNFLGTTDNAPLILRVNNQLAGYTTGDTGNYNVSFGYWALRYMLSSTGIGNTAFGAQALQGNTSGLCNTAIGTYALDANITGSYNVAIGWGASGRQFDTINNLVPINNVVAIGYQALRNNTKGSNTAIGYEAGVENRSGEGLTAVGFKALHQNTSGEFNTALGYHALWLNTTGYWNVALGSGSLQNNTTGYHNTAGGNSSLHFNLTGYENVAFGEQSLSGNLDGNYNTAVGTRSLWSVNQTSSGDVGYGQGNSNTAVGFEALREISTGSSNVGIGQHALRFNKTGNDNIAVGMYSLSDNIAGNNNIAIGRSALYDNITGNDNVAVGYMALRNNTIAEGNVAVGTSALMANSEGDMNIAIGYQALYSNTDGCSNFASGYNTLYSNTTGGGNIASGNYSLYSNTTGARNIAIGQIVLYSNTTGSSNTAIGNSALHSNTTGFDNTAIGFFALASNTTGAKNTAYGPNALFSNTTGNWNTAIGYFANVNAGALYSATAIGYDAIATASNQVRIGSSSVTSIGGYVAWSTLSDGRAKKNIKRDVPGLDFINLLQPVTYNLDLDAIDKLLKIGDSNRNDAGDSLRIEPSPEEKAMEAKARAIKEQQVYTGFIAQDVEKAARSIGYDFSGVDAEKNETDLYALRYSEFVVPLVKAVQELSEQNGAKDAAIASMQEQINELSELVNRLLEKEDNPFPGPEKTIRNPDASLEQNFPNPFNQSTTINYTLPKTLQSAKIIVTNTSGGICKQMFISGTGAGSVTLEAGSLFAGIYYYSLFVNDTLVDTKRMVLTK